MKLSTTELNAIQVKTLKGEETTLGAYADKVKLIVNVASRCGLSPQYEQLERLHVRHADRGFTVLGFPSNQFLQELGSSEAIGNYCADTWGVTFPMFEKIAVNGRHRHPLYQWLTTFPYATGRSGRIKWNFEKFVVTPEGEVSRFLPAVQPEDPIVIATIERALASRTS